MLMTQEAMADHGARAAMAEQGAWEASMAGSPPPPIFLGRLFISGGLSGGAVARGSGEPDGTSRGSGEPDGTDGTLGGALAADTLGGALAADTLGGALAAHTLGGALAAQTLGGALAAQTLGGALAAHTLGGALAAQTLGGARARTRTPAANSIASEEELFWSSLLSRCTQGEPTRSFF